MGLMMAQVGSCLAFHRPEQTDRGQAVGWALRVALGKGQGEFYIWQHFMALGMVRSCLSFAC